MENQIGKVCPDCQNEIAETDAVQVGTACETPNYEGCREENNDGVNSGCSEQHREAPHVCANCGNELQDGQEFCPKCGQRAGAPVYPYANAASNAAARMRRNNAKKKKLLIAGIAAVAVVAVIVVVCLGGGIGKKDFNDLYPQLDEEMWCTVAEDGSYLKIDTNPFDTDSDDFTLSYYENYFMPADEMIQQINKDLGFPDALYEKMTTSTWSMGKQSDSNKNYTVSWTYHPDKGLEVMYEIKD